MKTVIKRRGTAGFEVLESNESGVIFKRVIAARGRKLKDVQRIEMTLPKVRMVYFSEDDLNRLNQIEGEISRNISTKKGRLEQVIDGLKKFIVE